MARRQPYSYGDYTYDQDELQANYGVPQMGQFGSFHDLPAAGPQQAAQQPQQARQATPAAPPGPLAPPQQPSAIPQTGGVPPAQQRAADPTQFNPSALGGSPVSQGGLHSDAALSKQLQLSGEDLNQFLASGQAHQMFGGAAGADSPFQNLVQGQVDFSGMGTVGGSAGGGTRFEGFNVERASAAGDAKSAKDAFYRILAPKGITLEPGQPWEYYGAKIRDEIIPALQEAGYPVREGNGRDTIMVFSNERGWEEIDIIGDAGPEGRDPRFWWGDKASMTGGTAGGGTPLNPNLLTQALQGASTEDIALAQQLGIDTNNPLWRQMFEAYFGGGQAPDLEQQLRQQTGITYQP